MYFCRPAGSVNRPACQECQFPNDSVKVAVVGGVGRSTEAEGVGVEAEEGVQEKMEEVEEGCQVAAAEYRKKTAEEVGHHMHRAIKVCISLDDRVNEVGNTV